MVLTAAELLRAVPSEKKIVINGGIINIELSLGNVHKSQIGSMFCCSPM